MSKLMNHKSLKALWIYRLSGIGNKANSLSKTAKGIILESLKTIRQFQHAIRQLYHARYVCKIQKDASMLII